MGAHALASDVALDVGSMAAKLLRLLDRVDYRVVISDADREEVFRLRYESYRREDGVGARFDRRLSDRYDDLDNTTIVAMYIDGEVAGTVRVSVATAAHTEFPAMEVFPDLLEPHLAEGKTLVDPTRMATKEDFSKAYPGLMPYLLIRVPWMIAEYYRADAIIAGVRAEHRAFYRRTFGSRQLGEGRLYPTLLKPQYLTYGEYRQVREAVQQRFPSFRSTAFERRMLVEGQTPSVAASPRLEAPIPLPAASSAMA
ncbi:MAG: N-acyl amino acid synthase FeeM domain-containing protein [Bauldia sp.]